MPFREILIRGSRERPDPASQSAYACSHRVRATTHSVSTFLKAVLVEERYGIFRSCPPLYARDRKTCHLPLVLAHGYSCCLIGSRVLHDRIRRCIIWTVQTIARNQDPVSWAPCRWIKVCARYDGRLENAVTTLSSALWWWSSLAETLGHAPRR